MSRPIETGFYDDIIKLDSPIPTSQYILPPPMSAERLFQMSPLNDSPLGPSISLDDLGIGPSEKVKHRFLITTLPPYSKDRPDEPITVAILTDDMKEALLALPGFPTNFEPMSRKYDIRPVHGAGMGIFATEDIPAGDLIIRERPLVLSTSQLPAGVANGMLAAARDRLLVENAKAFWALHNCEDDSVDKFKGILNTNAVEARLPGWNGSCSAVCKDISRVNHSCRPNARLTWDAATLSVSLRAMWPISCGEEITVNYCGDDNIPRDQRRDRLLACYKFLCSCPLCSLPVAASKRSDVQRTIIQKSTLTDAFQYFEEGDSALMDWLQDPTAPEDAITRRCHAMFKMMEEERFYGFAPWLHFQRACMAHCALGNEKQTRQWAQRAAAWTRAHCGHDGGWDAVAKEPRKAGIWGLKAKVQPA